MKEQCQIGINDKVFSKVIGGKETVNWIKVNTSKGIRRIKDRSKVDIK